MFHDSKITVFVNGVWWPARQKGFFCLNRNCVYLCLPLSLYMYFGFILSLFLFKLHLTMASESFKQFDEWLEAGKILADELATKKVKFFINYFSIMAFT